MSDQKSKAEQLRLIKGGKGIQHILDRAYTIFGNPLVVFDMEYKLIASSDGMVEDDPFCAEFLKNGALSPELIYFSMHESFIDSVSYTAEHDGITYLISDKLKYDRIFGQLYNKNKMPVADLVIVNSGCAFDDETAGLVKALCTILSKELSRDAYYQEYGQTYQESILRKLIEGDIEEKGVYAAHVANIDAGLKSVIFAAVAYAPNVSGNHDGLRRLRDLLHKSKPAHKYYIYLDYIVILISTDIWELNIRRSFGKLLGVFETEDMRCGVSRGFENLFELSERYFEAISALSHGENNNRERVFLYNFVEDDTI